MAVERAANAATSPTKTLPAPAKAPRAPFDWRELWLRVLPPVIGFAMLVGIWALLTQGSKTFPTPAATFDAAVKLFADPFYSKGPNDQGIGWNVLFSLERVGLGFGMAALVGIPLGFLIGRFEFFNRMVQPLISLLRPVSPLAWLPIGLLVFKAANPAQTGMSRLNSRQYSSPSLPGIRGCSGQPTPHRSATPNPMSDRSGRPVVSRLQGPGVATGPWRRRQSMRTPLLVWAVGGSFPRPVAPGRLPMGVFTH